MIQPATRKAVLWSLAATSAVSAVLALVVGALLAANHYQFRGDNPMDSGEMVSLRRQLSDQPDDDMLRGQLRQLDIQLRREYFRRLDFAARGGTLLVVFALLAGASAAGGAVLGRNRHRPRGPRNSADAQVLAEGRARLAVTVASAAIAVTLGAWAAATRTAGDFLPSWRDWQYSQSDVPTGGAGNAGSPAPADTQGPPSAQDFGPAPGPEQLAANWPRFRGPAGDGTTFGDQPPPGFDGQAMTNVLWKSPVPMSGESSPVVWGQKVFLTAADALRREVYCFSVADGSLLWRRQVATPRSAPPANEPMDMTGYAAPTPAVDGRAVYVSFANGDVAAFDMDGRQLWAHSFGPMNNIYGHATSLLLHGELLLVLLDHGEVNEGVSGLLALDCRTGKTVWQSRRPVGSSWSTPLVISSDQGQQVVTASKPWVIAYELEKGQEIWRASAVDGDVASSLVFAGGLVLAITPEKVLAAVRPGRGDITTDGVAWRIEDEDAVPDITSPASDGKRLLLVSTHGLLSCYDLAGKRLWQHEVHDETFNGSPLIAAGRAYILGNSGKMYSIDMEQGQTEVVGELGEETTCSPAWVGGRLFVRGKTNLYCIGLRD